jgi:hypothetical protein
VTLCQQHFGASFGASYRTPHRRHTDESFNVVDGSSSILYSDGDGSLFSSSDFDCMTPCAYDEKTGIQTIPASRFY